MCNGEAPLVSVRWKTETPGDLVRVAPRLYRQGLNVENQPVVPQSATSAFRAPVVRMSARRQRGRRRRGAVAHASDRDCDAQRDAIIGLFEPANDRRRRDTPLHESGFCAVKEQG